MTHLHTWLSEKGLRGLANASVWEATVSCRKQKSGGIVSTSIIEEPRVKIRNKSGRNPITNNSRIVSQQAFLVNTALHLQQQRFENKAFDDSFRKQFIPRPLRCC